MASISPPYNTIYPTRLPNPQATSSQPVQHGLTVNPLGAPNLSDSNQVSAHPATADKIILCHALQRLGNIQNLPQDEAYMQHLGLPPIFHNGREALQVIQNNNIRVAFGDMGDTKAHAQWVADQRLIMINDKYRGDHSPTTLYAIAEAIYHEAGHAAALMTDPRTGQRQNLSIGGQASVRHSIGNGFSTSNLGPVGDDQSSLQEESECLALNTMAHRYHEAIDPTYAQAASNSPLLRDGVQLYSRLFFDADPYKNALIARIIDKYGELPLSSPGHEPPTPQEPLKPLPLAYRVMQRIQGQTQQAPTPTIFPFQAIQKASSTIPNPAQTSRVSYLA